MKLKQYLTEAVMNKKDYRRLKVRLDQLVDRYEAEGKELSNAINKATDAQDSKAKLEAWIGLLKDKDLKSSIKYANKKMKEL